MKFTPDILAEHVLQTNVGVDAEQVRRFAAGDFTWFQTRESCARVLEWVDEQQRIAHRYHGDSFGIVHTKQVLAYGALQLLDLPEARKN